MSTVGFIIDGVRHASFIAPQWFPDAGMTVWMFLSELNAGDVERMANNLRNVQWCVLCVLSSRLTSWCRVAIAQQASVLLIARSWASTMTFLAFLGTSAQLPSSAQLPPHSAEPHPGPSTISKVAPSSLHRHFRPLYTHAFHTQPQPQATDSRIPDNNTTFLRRPLDVLRDLRDGACTIMPEHAWRLWDGTQRWAYFVVRLPSHPLCRADGRTSIRWSTRSGDMGGSS